MKATERLYAKAVHALKEGRLETARETCDRLTRRAPRHAAGWDLLGRIHQQRHEWAAAAEHFQHAVALDPDQAPFHNNLGLAHRELGRPAEAIACFEQALVLRPDYEVALNNLGLAQMAQGDLEAAVASFERAIQARPTYAKAHLNLGNARSQLGRPEEALASLREALRLEPLYPEALNSLGAVLHALGRAHEAVPCFRRALALRPRYAKALLNLGNALAELEEHEEALRSVRLALALEPGYLKALVVQGTLLEKMGQVEAALAVRQEAARLAPESAEVQLALGRVLQRLRRFPEALAAFDRALQIDAGFAPARASRLELRSERCDWRGRDEDIALLKEATRRSLAKGEVPPLSAGAAHRVVPCTAEEQRDIAQAAARQLAARLAPLRASLAFTRAPRAAERRRLGYLSGDFRNHATGHLMQGLFGLHDRRRFEVHAYSYGPDDGSPYRKRISADCDRFVDIAGLSATESARRIHEDGVDILIDLVGAAGNGRLEVLAVRPAPIQVHFLGFPATTGADFIDYFITDLAVTPPGQERFFTERLVRLPGSYQVTDHQQPIADAVVSRGACGLPPDGFVFCCFGANYKIEPTVFEAWMRILGRVPGSVLWLLETSPDSRENLGREAAARGIAPGRLVFADVLPKPDHLARHRLAGLFLDTPLCNAHTTASDALWAGLPVLTCPGQVFASRVAASLLTAVGLPEMIARGLAEYEDRAVRLSQSPEELGRLRVRLAEARTHAPLFDTPRFVRGLERAYAEMWGLYASGQPPRPIVIPPE